MKEAMKEASYQLKKRSIRHASCQGQVAWCDLAPENGQNCPKAWRFDVAGCRL